jgi:hypothetical protein
VALQSFRTLAASHIGGFLNYIRCMVGLLGRVISSSQGLYLHRTKQHRKTRTNIRTLSGIRTHDPSNQPAKIHASDRTATVTGIIKRGIKSRRLKLAGNVARMWTIRKVFRILIRNSEGKRPIRRSKCVSEANI